MRQAHKCRLHRHMERSKDADADVDEPTYAPAMKRLSRLSLVTCMQNSQFSAGYLPFPLLHCCLLLLLFTAAVDVCGDI